MVAITLQVLGLGCLVAGFWAAFGLAGGLLAGGVALLFLSLAFARPTLPAPVEPHMQGEEIEWIS